jgi:glycosyltransferase involved in cell wall biosynthesis
MRLAICTQYYLPEAGAPQRRLSQLAERLRRRGHEVWILTAMPNYPAGKLFPGYGGWLRRERVDGIEIIRCFIRPSQSASLLPRMTSYLSFVGSSLINGAIALPRLDCLIVESPPLFLGMSGFLLARMKKAKLVFNVSDLWPDSALQLGVIERGPGYRLAQRLESFCYKKSQIVSGQSREIIEDIHRRFPDVEVYHFSNSVDTELFRPDAGSAPLPFRRPSGCKFLVTYVGLHGLAQGLEQILDAAERMKDDGEVRFLLVGDGPEKERLVEMSGIRGLSNVHFEPPIESGVVPALLANSDIILVTLRSPLKGAVPSKLYEAMASGRPVVLAAEGEARDIVEQAGCGLVVRPGDGAALAGAVLQLAANESLRKEMGQRGRRAAETQFDRAVVTERFIDRLESLCAARSENAGLQ